MPHYFVAKTQAKKYLTQVVQVRRDVMKQATDLDAALMNALLPENVLPYVIHLLAHLDTFEADAPQYRNTHRYNYSTPNLTNQILDFLFWPYFAEGWQLPVFVGAPSVHQTNRRRSVARIKRMATAPLLTDFLGYSRSNRLGSFNTATAHGPQSF